MQSALLNANTRSNVEDLAFKAFRRICQGKGIRIASSALPAPPLTPVGAVFPVESAKDKAEIKTVGLIAIVGLDAIKDKAEVEIMEKVEKKGYKIDSEYSFEKICEKVGIRVSKAEVVESEGEGVVAGGIKEDKVVDVEGNKGDDDEVIEIDSEDSEIELLNMDEK